MTSPGLFYRLLARGVRATSIVDRGFNFFDRLRSRVVMSLGNERFFTAFNDVTYGSQDRYRPDRRAFRPELYDWERRVIRRTFPAPPARVLVGGAGGGREAFALAGMGYDVVAFDRAEGLVETMVHALTPEARIEPLLGNYQDLPQLRRPRDGAQVDLSERERFDAALFGWGSFSHIPIGDRLRVLERVSRLTAGPMLISYLPRPSGVAAAAARPATFSVHIGLYRELSFEEVAALGAQVGLEPVPLEDDQEGAFIVLRSVNVSRS